MAIKERVFHKYSQELWSEAVRLYNQCSSRELAKRLNIHQEHITIGFILTLRVSNGRSASTFTCSDSSVSGCDVLKFSKIDA